MTASFLTALVVSMLVYPAVRPRARRPLPTATHVRRPRLAPLRTRRPTPILVALAAFSALAIGPLIVAAAAIAMFVLPRLRAVLAVKHARRQIDAALPDAIEMLVLVVHAGMTPHQAIRLLEARAPAPIRSAFAAVHHRTSRGAPLADALAALPEHLGPGAVLMADALKMSERYGTPIGTALEQLSHDVRERRRRATEAAARKLPIRMSFPLVACTLPSFVLVAIVPAVLAALESLDATGF